MPERPVVVDSSVWVPCLRRNPDPGLAEWLRDAILAGVVATAGIILVELLQAARDQEFAALRQRLESLILLDTNADTWRLAAENGSLLRRRGIIVPTTDLIIATVARQHGVALAHCDAHFELVAPHLKLETVDLLNA